MSLQCRDMGAGTGGGSGAQRRRGRRACRKWAELGLNQLAFLGLLSSSLSLPVGEYQPVGGGEGDGLVAIISVGGRPWNILRLLRDPSCH